MITLTPSNTLPNTYSLNWSSQQSHIFDGLRNLVGQDDLLLTDVTLACDGEYIQAHKLVLSLCSSFFKDLFKKNKADKSNTIIILGNVSALNLRYLIQFMYQGRVDIPSKDVDSFLQAGNLLKIEGLIGNVTETGRQFHANPNASHQQPPQHHQTHHKVDPTTVPQQRPASIHASRPVAVSSSSKVTIPVSSAVGESPPTPNKKPRLSETSGSGSEVAPVIVGEPVTISVAANQGQPPSTGVLDPLEDSEQYETGDMEEGDGEEGIDFNNLKTEPIQVYSGYEEENDHDQSEMMHNESVGEDSYGGSNDDSYGYPPHPAGLSMTASLPTVSVPGPGPSSSSQPMSMSRPRGSIPVILNGRFFEIQAADDSGRVRAKCMVCSKMNAKQVLISGRFNPTSNFNTHLKRRHPDEYKTYEQFLVSIGRSKKPLVLISSYSVAAGDPTRQ